ncbi:MAG TPA: DUF3108 domain-containing protein [Chromatiales bacterium]|nr:DUF3108 domain-containing protein [Thiotrichales bacterium]HIP67702.1 DUF3108 domain-containing protein [Chromatiales bacterium]
MDKLIPIKSGQLKMRLRSTIITLLFLLNFTVAAAELKPFTATYEAIKFDLVLGEIKVSLQPQGKHFIYSKESTTKGLVALFRNEQVKEKSTLTLSEKGLRVLDYQYQLKRGDENRTDSFTFESPEKVNGIYKKQPFSLDVPHGTLDRSSIEVALMRDANPDVKMLSYSAVEKDKLKTYNFEYQGEQIVETPAGKFQCLNYKRVRSSGKRSTTLCLAPELNNLPVKITHNEKGTEFYMVLKSYN